jgi:hypothetical protein
MEPAPKAKAVPELLATLTNRQLIEMTGCHFTTIFRWRRQNKLPPHIEKLLRFMALHELDQLGWKGWKLENGKLHTPGGQSFTAGEVEAIQIRQQEIAFYAAERRAHLRRPEQPGPYQDVTDEFLKKFGDELAMKFEKPPEFLQVDELEHEGLQPKELDPWLIEEKKRALERGAAARREESAATQKIQNLADAPGNKVNAESRNKSSTPKSHSNARIKRR